MEGKRGNFLLFGLILIFLMVFGLALSAQSIPPITDIIAKMQDPPRSDRGLKMVDSGEGLRFVRASYKVAKPACLVEVYASRDARKFKLGTSNVVCAIAIGKSPVVSFEYRVLKGKPSYAVQRADGLWFLFVFPDEPVDVCGFIQRFGDGYGFFESNFGGASIEDCFPSILGKLAQK